MRLSQQLENLQFVAHDPFEMSDGMFDGLKNHVSELHMQEIHRRCYKNYFEHLQMSERRSVVLYRMIADVVKADYHDFFIKMSQEEDEHGEMFRLLNNRLFGTGDMIDAGMPAIYNTLESINGQDLHFWLPIAAGYESTLVAVFQATVPLCQNHSKKDFFNCLIDDELDHIGQLHHVIQHYLSMAPTDHLPGVMQKLYRIARERKLFSEKILSEFLHGIGRSDLLHVYYSNNPWHDQYQQTLYQSLLSLANLIDPCMTLEDFIEQSGIDPA